MSHLYDPYENDEQNSGHARAQMQSDPQRTSHPNSVSSQRSARPGLSPNTSSLFDPFLEAQSRPYKEEELRRSAYLHTSRAREESLYPHRSYAMTPPSQGYRKPVGETSDRSLNWLPTNKNPNDHDDASKYYTSAAPSIFGGIGETRRSAAASSLPGSGESRFMTIPERNPHMQSNPGFGKNEFPVRETSSAQPEFSQRKYTSESASNILSYFGLEKDDMDKFISYPEDQITPQNLPFILRQIRQQKKKNSVGAIQAAPYPEPKPTTSVSDTHFSMDSRILLGVSKSSSLKESGPIQLKPKPCTYTPSPSVSSGQPGVVLYDGLKEPSRSVKQVSKVPEPKQQQQQQPAAQSPTPQVNVDSSVPAPGQLADYIATTPGMFPHRCSLCNRKCFNMKEWINHQNSALHIENCQQLRLRFPDWDYLLTSLSDSNVDTRSSPIRPSQYGPRRRGSSSRSRSRSYSPRPHCSSGSGRDREKSRYRGHSRSNSPHQSSRRTRRSRSQSRSQSPLCLSSSSRYRSRSRSQERRSSPRRRDDRRSSAKRSQERSSSEKLSACQMPLGSAEALAQKLLGSSAIQALTNQSDLEEVVKTLAPALVAELSKIKTSPSSSSSCSTSKKDPNTKGEASLGSQTPAQEQKKATPKTSDGKQKTELTKGEMMEQNLLLERISCFELESIMSPGSQFASKKKCVLRITNLPLYEDCNYTEREVANLLTPFGLQHEDEHLHNIYVIPQRRMALAVMPTPEMAINVIRACVKDCFTLFGYKLIIKILEDNFSTPMEFYQILSVCMNEKISLDQAERIVFIKNISLSEAKSLRDVLKKIVNVKNYTPLLNKVFIEFFTIPEADCLGVRHSLLRHPPQHFIYRLGTPRNKKFTARPNKPENVLPDLSLRVTDAAIPKIFCIPHCCRPPFYVTMTTFPFIFPTNCPWFNIPTFQNPAPVTSVLSRYTTIMMMGLPEDGYCHVDVVRMVTGVFPRSKFPSLFYTVTVLPLQRRAFIYFKNPKSCWEFARRHITEPFRIQERPVDVYYVSQDMNPGLTEENMYRQLMKLSNNHVPTLSGLNQRLLVVVVTVVSLELIQAIMQDVTSVGRVAGFLPLGNMICIEMSEPSDRTKVMKTKLGFLTDPHLSKKVKRVDTVENLQQLLLFNATNQEEDLPLADPDQTSQDSNSCPSSSTKPAAANTAPDSGSAPKISNDLEMVGQGSSGAVDAKEEKLSKEVAEYIWMKGFTKRDMMEKRVKLKEISCLKLKHVNSPKFNTRDKWVLLISQLPEWKYEDEDCTYTEQDLVDVLTPFGFQHKDEDLPNIYILPQNRLAFVILPTVRMGLDIIRRNGRITFLGQHLLFRFQQEYFKTPLEFYQTLMKLKKEKVKLCGQDKTIFIKNISLSELINLMDVLKKIGNIKYFIPLLNKVFIEFNKIRDADCLGVWFSLLRHPPQHNIYRLGKTAGTALIPIRPTRALPESNLRVIDATVPTTTVPRGCNQPLMVTMTTFPFIFPTVCPWFNIPPYKTLSEVRAPSRYTTIMMTGLPEDGYCQLDVARMVWSLFTQRNSNSLFYRVMVLPLQRRAFIYFNDPNSCWKFSERHKAKPFCIKNKPVYIYFVSDNMNPGFTEGDMYRQLMKLSNAHVPALSGLDQRLLVVQVSEVSLELIQAVMKEVVSVGRVAGFLPLGNRICIEMLEPSDRMKVMEAKLGSLTDPQIWKKVRQVDTIQNLNQHLLNSIVVTTDQDKGPHQAAPDQTSQDSNSSPSNSTEPDAANKTPNSASAPETSKNVDMVEQGTSGAVDTDSDVANSDGLTRTKKLSEDQTLSEKCLEVITSSEKHLAGPTQSEVHLECTIPSEKCPKGTAPSEEQSKVLTQSKEQTQGPKPSEELPQGPTPSEELPQGPTPSEELPQGPTPSEELPQGPTPSEELPQGPTPSEELPQGPTPSEELPQGPTPSEELPQGPTPSEELPQGPTPSEELPQGPTPSEELPQGPTPSEELPQGPTPSEELPQGPTPSEELSQGPTPSEELPQGPTPSEELPQGPTPSEELPQGPTPSEELPQGPTPSEELPQGPTPSEELPQGPTPSEELPQGPTPSEELPQGPTPSEELPQGPTPSEELSQGPTPSEELAQGPTVSVEKYKGSTRLEECPEGPTTSRSHSKTSDLDGLSFQVLDSIDNEGMADQAESGVPPTDILFEVRDSVTEYQSVRDLVTEVAVAENVSNETKVSNVTKRPRRGRGGTRGRKPKVLAANKDITDQEHFEVIDSVENPAEIEYSGPKGQAPEDLTPDAELEPIKDEEVCKVIISVDKQSEPNDKKKQGHRGRPTRRSVRGRTSEGESEELQDETQTKLEATKPDSMTNEEGTNKVPYTDSDGNETIQETEKVGRRRSTRGNKEEKITSQTANIKEEPKYQVIDPVEDYEAPEEVVMVTRSTRGQRGRTAKRDIPTQGQTAAKECQEGKETVVSVEEVTYKVLDPFEDEGALDASPVSEQKRKRGRPRNVKATSKPTTSKKAKVEIEEEPTFQIIDSVEEEEAKEHKISNDSETAENSLTPEDSDKMKMKSVCQGDGEKLMCNILDSVEDYQGPEETEDDPVPDIMIPGTIRGSNEGEEEQKDYTNLTEDKKHESSTGGSAHVFLDKKTIELDMNNEEPRNQSNNIVEHRSKEMEITGVEAQNLLTLDEVSADDAPAQPEAEELEPNEELLVDDKGKDRPIGESGQSLDPLKSETLEAVDKEKDDDITEESDFIKLDEVRKEEEEVDLGLNAATSVVGKHRKELMGPEAKRSRSQSPDVPNDDTLLTYNPSNPLGQEFVVPAAGFFCNICSIFYTNENTEDHCSSRIHFDNMKNYYLKLKTTPSRSSSPTSSNVSSDRV